MFMCVIFMQRCWIVHIPFVGMGKFIIIIIIIHSLELFISALADGLSLEFE